MGINYVNTFTCKLLYESLKITRKSACLPYMLTLTKHSDWHTNFKEEASVRSEHHSAQNIARPVSGHTQ